MANLKGRLYLLKLATDGSGGTLAGLRNLSAKINNEMVDITNKDSNGWRTLLDGAGTQSVTLSADGVAADHGTYATVKGYAQNNSINGFQIVGPDGDLIALQAAITSFQEAGAYNKELTFSITLESSGQPTFTNL